QQLATEVKREEFHEWTPEELVYYRKKNPFGVSTRCDPKDPNYVEEENILGATAEYRKYQDLRVDNKERIKDQTEAGKGKERERSGQTIDDSNYAAIYSESSGKPHNPTS
ncbi:hypothetical protein K3495_g11868, partial [Podosphaera aphanis]